MFDSPLVTTPTAFSRATFQSSSEGVVSELLPPDGWAAVFNLTVMDPDGWRVDGKSWEEPITEHEFRTRVMSSTIRAYGYPGTAL